MGVTLSPTPWVSTHPVETKNPSSSTLIRLSEHRDTPSMKSALVLGVLVSMVSCVAGQDDDQCHTTYHDQAACGAAVLPPVVAFFPFASPF